MITNHTYMNSCIPVYIVFSYVILFATAPEFSPISNSCVRQCCPACVSWFLSLLLCQVKKPPVALLESFFGVLDCTVISVLDLSVKRAGFKSLPRQKFSLRFQHP